MENRGVLCGVGQRVDSIDALASEARPPPLEWVRHDFVAMCLAIMEAGLWKGLELPAISGLDS
jgi:hypothetical protein